jgi:hypothetical protein
LLPRGTFDVEEFFELCSGERVMRPFGTLVEKAVKFRAPSIPSARLDRVRPRTGYRLDEGINELFDYACITSDLDAAGDLVALMEQWHARRSYKDFEQRRLVVIQLKRMRGELDRRHIMRGTRPIASEPAGLTPPTRDRV